MLKILHDPDADGYLFESALWFVIGMRAEDALCYALKILRRRRQSGRCLMNPPSVGWARSVAGTAKLKPDYSVRLFALDILTFQES